MRYYKCDQCGKKSCGEPDRYIIGYSRPHDGKITMVETSFRYDFCTRQCMVQWMAEGIRQEVANGFRHKDDFI